MQLTSGQTAFAQHLYGNLIRHPSSLFPYSLTVHDRSVVGNGASYDLTVINSALGEYFERDHFYNHVAYDKVNNYSSCNPADLSKSLTLLINQVKETPADPEKHTFHLTQVVNIYSEEIAYLPTVLFSLGSDHPADRAYIPYIDTCGQACHLTRDKAFCSALLEFVERQALIHAWLTKDYNTKIIVDDLKPISQQLPFVEKLCSNGEILIFNISKNFPIPIVLIVYFAHSELDIVQYSVGLAAGFNPIEAYTKAWLELWQTYCFLYLNAKRQQWHDTSGKFKYLHGLLKFNHRHTRNIFDFNNGIQSEIAIKKYLKSHDYNVETLKGYLLTLSKHVFAYQSSSLCHNQALYFCKIISPEFFIHMDTTLKLNYENAYTKAMGSFKKLLNKTTIPFP